MTDRSTPPGGRLLRRVLLIIGSVVAAGLVVSVFVVPLIRLATGSTDPTRDPGIAAVETILIVVLGGLIYREILRAERRGRQDTTPTSSGG